MKRNGVLVFGMIAMLFASTPVGAQTLSKSEMKAVKALAKDYAKDGYKSTSMAYTMEEKITEFRLKLKANTNLVEIVSQGEGVSSFSAEMAAENAASIRYATAAGSVIKGGIEREFGNITENYDKFHGSYIQNVAKFIMPLLKKQMMFSKKEGGTYYVKVGFLLDENKAKEAREKACDEALNTIANGQVFGKSVRKYVDEEVYPDAEANE